MRVFKKKLGCLVVICAVLVGLFSNEVDSYAKSLEQKNFISNEIGVPVSQIKKVVNLSCENLEEEGYTATAVLEDEDGNTSECDVDLQLSEVTLYSTDSFPGNSKSNDKMMVLTATTNGETKHSFGSKNILRGSIYWVDNFGPSNTLKYVTGHRDSARGTGALWYGDNLSQGIQYYYPWTAPNKNITNNDHSGMTGLQFMMKLSTPTWDNKTISLTITTSVTD